FNDSILTYSLIFVSSRRRHTRSKRDWSSDVCSSDLASKQRVYDDIHKELEALAMKDERIREAFETWEELSRTPDELIAYESRLRSEERRVGKEGISREGG